MQTTQTVYSVSVEDAISRGQKMVNRPSVIIMILVTVLSIVLAVMNLIPAWGIGIGIVLSFVAAWLCWSIMITKWRLWAFENVRNVHQLRKRAIQEKLIWPNKSIFEKTEIRSAAEKAKWQSLQSRFSQQDTFTDDLTVPAETIIYYSKFGNFLEMGIMLVAAAAGIYLIVITDRVWLGSGMTALCAWLAWKEYRQATNKKPQIIISDKGLQTASTQFYPWNSIGSEEAIIRAGGNNSNRYLSYNHPGGGELFNIDDLDITTTELNQLLILYRNRSKQRRS